MQKKPLNLIFIALIILFPKLSLAIESLAKTALIIDLSTNEVLLEKNSKAKTYPSSMTKMMTALVAFEKIKNGDDFRQIANLFLKITDDYALDLEKRFSGTNI